jgi:protein TonB
MTIAIKDSSGAGNSNKQGTQSQNSESNAGESSRSNPVCLDVAVTIRSLPNESGGMSKAIREEVRTVIVFDNGAVLRCSESLPVGYSLILTNSNARDVVCRVVGGRSMPNIKGYVEVQFLETVSNFWSTHQDGGAPSFAAPQTPEHLSLGPTPSLESIDGLLGVPAPAAPRESKAKAARPSPELTAPSSSSYSHAENANPSTIGNWKSFASEPAVEKQSNAAMSETSEADFSASPSGPSRDFMSKGLMAYDKPPSSAAAKSGRMPLIAGAAVLALAGVAGVVYFMHQNGAPASVTTSSIVNKQTTPQSISPSNSPEPALPEPTTSMAMNAQPATQPVAVEKSSSILTAVPAVVTNPVTSDSTSNSASNERNTRKPEKNASPARQPEPLASPKPAAANLTANLKMNTPSAPARKPADLGGSAAPPAEIAAPEATGGSPSAALLTSSSRISNPPAPPPAAPAPVAANKVVTEPKLISSAQLAYPPAARQANIQGTVTVTANIDEFGRVFSARALNGPLMLREAAVNAVKQWKYSPGLVDGKPAPSQVTVGVAFKLN